MKRATVPRSITTTAATSAGGQPGAGLWYEDLGRGAPVLLLHGFAGTARAHFAPLLPALAAERRVIAPDLRGHGRSVGMPRRLDTSLFDLYATDLLDLLDRLRLPTIDLVGYSDGGEVALLLATRLGPRARSAVVWGVSGRTPPPAIVALYADPEQRIPGWPALRAELDQLHGPGVAVPLLREWTAAMTALEARGGAIFEAAAGVPTCPVLIVAGDRDPFNPLAATRALAGALPTAQLVVLPGAGHDLLAERGPQLTALIRRALQAPAS